MNKLQHKNSIDIAYHIEKLINTSNFAKQLVLKKLI